MKKQVVEQDQSQFDRRILSALKNVSSEDELLSEYLSMAMEVSGAETCDILLGASNGTLVLRASSSAPEFVGRIRLGKGVGLTGHAFITNAPIVIRSGLKQHPQYAKYPIFDDLPYNAAVLQPIKSGKETLGVIMLQQMEPWEISDEQVCGIEKLGNYMADGLMAFRHIYGSGAQANRIGALSQVTSIIAKSPYLEEVLQLLVNLTAQQFNYKVCTVRLLDEQTSELVLRATQATVKAYQRKRAIKFGESIAGRAIVEQRSIVVPDVQVEEEYIGHDLAIEQGLRSMICVPLTIQERAVGVLTCYSDEIRDFEESEVKALETIAKQAALSIEHAKLQVRNTLMQEMHHRVKNNLQQVVSLLRLQLRHSHYRSIEEAINDSLARILAIAAVHDLLSREDLDHVGVRSIAETLIHHQQQSFVLPHKQIAFEVRGEDVKLNMTQATQIALVLNELIQNAVEHGFCKSDEGAIHINVESHEQDVVVWVCNSGDPLPDGFDHMVASNLGLQIVSNLSRALGGSFTINNINGWAVSEVRFTRQTSE